VNEDIKPVNLFFKSVNDFFPYKEMLFYNTQTKKPAFILQLDVGICSSKNII
jgi:hypothetical protein